MKFSKMCAVAALACAGTAMTVSASTVFFGSGVRDSGFGGGEFITNFVGGNSYRSFCLETAEQIQLGNQGANNYQYEIGTGAVNGGVSGGNPDPVSSAAASIFVKWLQGGYGAPTNALAEDVQRAIWDIEGENQGTLSANAILIRDAAIAAYPVLTDNAVTSGNFPNIRVVNPFRMLLNDQGVLTRVDYQSQIVLIPLPAASGMALAGLALVGGIRRRK